MAYRLAPLPRCVGDDVRRRAPVPGKPSTSGSRSAMYSQDRPWKRRRRTAQRADGAAARTGVVAAAGTGRWCRSRRPWQFRQQVGDGADGVSIVRLEQRRQRDWLRQLGAGSSRVEQGSVGDFGYKFTRRPTAPVVIRRHDRRASRAGSRARGDAGRWRRGRRVVELMIGDRLAGGVAHPEARAVATLAPMPSTCRRTAAGAGLLLELPPLPSCSKKREPGSRKSRH